MKQVVPLLAAAVVAVLIWLNFDFGPDAYLDTDEFTVRAMVSEESADPAVELMRLHIDSQVEWKGVAIEDFGSKVEVRVVRADAPDTVQVDAPRINDEHIFGPHALIRSDRSALGAEGTVQYFIYGGDGKEVEAKVAVTPGVTE